MRVAVVHDWLVTYGGAERVLARILECFPNAEVFTLIDYMDAPERAFLDGRKIHTSFLQKLPFARRHYRSFLPLMPRAIESFDLSSFDLVISSSFCVAKGVLTGPEQLHVSYVHTPMRYAWDLQRQYLREAKLDRGLKGALARALLQRLRLWDANAVNGVDGFIANSLFVARRIWRAYRRQAAIIHPPVDTEYFQPGGRKEDFYVTASRLVPYKKVDTIVEAFAALPEKRLVVIGDGPELRRLKASAGRNVEFLGHQPASVLRDHLQRARAFVFAAYEDFGIAPVEAQACGTPVIAYGRGGATDSVIDGHTGLFFPEQSPDAIAAAIARFERSSNLFWVDPIRANALRFRTERFKRQLCAFVDARTRNFARATAPGKHERAEVAWFDAEKEVAWLDAEKEVAWLDAENRA
jgi:glycosyltransferase involved in cell wall biosynthesis